MRKVAESWGSHLNALPRVTWQMFREAECTTAACSNSGCPSSPSSPLPLGSCGVQCQPCLSDHSLSWWVSTSHTFLSCFIYPSFPSYVLLFLCLLLCGGMDLPVCRVLTPPFSLRRKSASRRQMGVLDKVCSDPLPRSPFIAFMYNI